MARKLRRINFTRGGRQWEAGGKPAKDNKAEFPEATGEYEIRLSVATPTGRYKFTEDPIYIRKMSADDPDDTCPTSFECPDIFSYSMDGPATLVLVNKNDEEKPTEYRYQLNVWDENDDEYVPIDPILSNGGRGGR